MITRFGSLITRFGPLTTRLASEISESLRRDLLAASSQFAFELLGWCAGNDSPRPRRCSCATDAHSEPAGGRAQLEGHAGRSRGISSRFQCLGRKKLSIIHLNELEHPGTLAASRANSFATVSFGRRRLKQCRFWIAKHSARILGLAQAMVTLANKGRVCSVFASPIALGSPLVSR